jgi:hypothetical protein
LLTFGRKKSKSDAITGIGFFMRRARALELTHNIASTPNPIEELDSLLNPALVEQALEQAGVATLCKRRLPLEMMRLVRDLHGVFLYVGTVSRMNIMLPMQHLLVAPSVVINGSRQASSVIGLCR